MSKTGPGKSHRQGMTLIDAMRKFSSEEAAEKWFSDERWPDSIECPRCGSRRIQEKTTHPTMPHRCRDCRKFFSVKTGSVMEGSNLTCQTWAIAIYLLATSLKSVSSMKLRRDLGITQKSAWHLAHRIRETFAEPEPPSYEGPVEVDETYMGGKRKNMPKSKREKMTGRGPVGKTAVVGIKDRDTNEVAAKVVQSTDAPTLTGFVESRSADGASVYTDDASAYLSLDRDRETVNHSAGEYVRGEVHTNGVESFWSMLKRAHKGTFHKMSPQHLQKYVTEFAGKHNIRESETIDQMATIAAGMRDKKLRYRDLVGKQDLER
ncbi:MAG: IS1595 family transposase [Albidovulum sp.]|nr:IS1595 family transposase [Albidovulum sp.]